MNAGKEKRNVGGNGVPNRFSFLFLFACLIICAQGLACFGIRPYPRYIVDGGRRCKGFTSQNQSKMERIIESYLGTPYKWGGEDRDGMDCSGLVVAVYRETLGISLPHSTVKLSSMGRKIGRKEVRFGDLVFFSEKGGKATHVGISLGGDQFVHASTQQGVIVSSLNTQYFRERYIVTRRVGL